MRQNKDVQMGGSPEWRTAKYLIRVGRYSCFSNSWYGCFIGLVSLLWDENRFVRAYRYRRAKREGKLPPGFQ